VVVVGTVGSGFVLPLAHIGPLVGGNCLVPLVCANYCSSQLVTCLPPLALPTCSLNTEVADEFYLLGQAHLSFAGLCAF
jgi:hypothetical protein